MEAPILNFSLTLTVPDSLAVVRSQVLKGMIALSAARFPKGTSGAQLDVLARQALAADRPVVIEFVTDPNVPPLRRGAR